MAGGGSKEANYWPGFVDALSNVVVVMVFVLVVFTIALIHFSQNKAKEMVQAAVQESQSEAEKQGSTEAMLIAEKAMREKEQMAAKVEQLTQALAESQRREKAAARASASNNAPSSQDARGGVTSRSQAGAVTKAEVEADTVTNEAGAQVADAEIRGEQSALAITFTRGNFELSDNTRKLLDVAFTKIAANASAQGIELVAAAETGPYSEGRRLSYYRNLALRNWLIEKGIPPSKIRVRIADKNTGGDRGVVQLSVAK